jgi:hypothetical protein
MRKNYVSECAHDPVEQVRGEMGRGDYFDVVANSLDEAKYARLDDDYHESVELHDSNRTDVRIVCRKCFLSTGWMKVDAPGMPAGIGLPAVRAKWDEMSGYDAEEWTALQRKTAKRVGPIAKFGGAR